MSAPRCRVLRDEAGLDVIPTGRCTMSMRDEVCTTGTRRRSHGQVWDDFLLWFRCSAYIFPVVTNVPIDVSAHAQ